MAVPIPQRPTGALSLTRVFCRRMTEAGAFAMPAKAASTRVAARIAGKSVPAAGAKPRAPKTAMSKLEAKRLEGFKSLMKKFRGKATFAGFDA